MTKKTLLVALAIVLSPAMAALAGMGYRARGLADWRLWMSCRKRCSESSFVSRSLGKSLSEGQ
jgi:hypothetical protein